MRDLRDLSRWRVLLPEPTRLAFEYLKLPPADCGAFVLPSPVDRMALRCIASREAEWDHVSVSRVERCPWWDEMEYVKRRFFRPDETVMQLHVPPAEHVSHHDFCLHLWRPRFVPIPRPDIGVAP